MFDWTGDWLGLKKLDEKKGLLFREAKGAHMQLTDEVLRKAFEEFFGPERDAADWAVTKAQHAADFVREVFNGEPNLGGLLGGGEL